MSRPTRLLPVRAMATLASLAIVLGTIGIAHAPPAVGASAYPWGQSLSFYGSHSEQGTWGPNESIDVELGTFHYTRDCEAGFKDFFYPYTDVYVVSAAPGSGGGLNDVNGAPNTVIGFSGGGFADETIAITAPSGNLGPGTYHVVYDECQDGKFQADMDAFFENAITVVAGPSDVPPLPEFAALKSGAFIKYIQFLAAHKAVEWLLNKLDDKLGNLPQTKLLWGLYGQLFKVAGDPREAALVALANTAKHYKGIHADPPDPGFRQVTVVTPYEVVDLQLADPIQQAAQTFATAGAAQGTVAESLLRSLERYQGAQQAGDPDWALVHARALRDSSALLADQLRRGATSAGALASAVLNDGRDLDALGAKAEAFRSGVQKSGFDAEVRREASNLGIPDQQLTELQTFLAGDGNYGFSESQVVTLLQTMRDDSSSFASDLVAFSSQMNGLVTQLLALPDTDDLYPTAHAGGPYTVVEGTTFVLSAAKSASTSPITTYAWDLDADGEFDDATGVSPTTSFTSPRTGWIGVRVTNQAGRANVAYATLYVTDVNQPPTIDWYSPSPSTAEVIVGAPATFSVSATDPNGDGLTYAWTIDDVAAGGSSTLEYAPDDEDIGHHIITVAVTDSSPLGGSVTQSWNVGVTQADMDGDGWHSNVDCDDTNHLVNPAQAELLGNSVDDDCDPATDDAAPNSAPLAHDVAGRTEPGVQVDLQLLGEDPNGQSLTYQIVTAPAVGNVSSPTSGGAVTFTPPALGEGTVSFTYRVTDGELTSNTAVVRVSVEEINEAPLADDLPTVETAEDTPTDPIDLAAAATDPDAGTSLVFRIFQAPASGSVSLSSDGVAVYTPGPDFHGADGFTYEVSDGEFSDTGVVPIWVTPVNDAPTISGSGSVTTHEEEPVAMTVESADLEGDPVTLSVTEAPTHGAVVPDGWGGFTYTPDADFSGTDEFEVTGNDGAADSSPLAVVVDVLPSNDAPTATGTGATTAEDTSVLIHVSGSDLDGDELLFVRSRRPSHGTVTEVDDDTFRYTPDRDYSGADVFTFRAFDGAAYSEIATVNVTVTAVNDAPVASALRGRRTTGDPLALTLPGTDADGDALTFQIVDQPSNGAVTPPVGATVSYTSAPAFTGTDTFTFRASDGSGPSNLATATITVLPADGTGRAVYTLDGHFAEGTSSNVDTRVPNQLQLAERASAFNVIWVAVSSKGTTVKIDTLTGEVLGEYWTSPDGRPRNPSRTTVDLNGNVWNSNRDGESVVHIGAIENGQCVDRNGNGAIETSTGLGDVLPWPNTSGGRGSVVDAGDECILHYVDDVRISAGTRHVSITRDNDVWVSGTGEQNFVLIDGDTGAIIREEPSVGHGGYGGLIDGAGVIWSARPLLRWDTALPLTGPTGGNWTGYAHDSYGLCIDPQGHVWNTSLGGDLIHKFAPDGTLLGSFDHGDHYAQGCAADANGHIWVAHSILSGSNSVGHLTNDGTFLGNVGVGSGPTGISVDALGKVWVTNHNSQTVSRIDPKAGPTGLDGATPVGAVDLTTVNLGGALYNYSDMTGSTLTGSPKAGAWSTVFDSGIDGAEWGDIDWNAFVPEGAAVTVSVASSTDGTSFSPSETVAPPLGAVTPTAAADRDLTVPNGRYLRVTVTFQRSSSGLGPVLYDLTASTYRKADIRVPHVSIDEGDSGTKNVKVDLTLSKANARDVTVDYAVSNGTASAGSDYTTVASGTATIPAGDTTHEVMVPVRGDTVPEPHETVLVTLSEPGELPVNANIASDEGKVTILNDDAVASFNVASSSVNETAASTTLTVAIPFPSVKATAVDYAPTGGTAGTADHGLVGGTLVIPAGSTSRSITIPIVNDAVDEPNETLTVGLSNARVPTTFAAERAAWAGPAFAAIGTPATHTLTIVDDDPAPRIDIADASVKEGDTGTRVVDVVVSLQAVSGQHVTATFSTSDGSAKAGEDYVAETGNVTIPAGTKKGTVSVTVKGDTAVETNERFSVTLSGLVNAVAGDLSADVSIVNDDTTGPTLGIGDVEVYEGDDGEQQAVLSAALGAPLSTDVTATFATVEGTAKAGQDYVASTGTLTIPAGETSAQVSIGVLGDETIEQHETFTVELADVRGAEPGDLLGAVTILNDDEEERVGGLNRVGTSVVLSQLGFPNADTAILARSDQFPDALAASTLAAEVGGPILLTPPSTLAQEVAEELERLGLEHIYVVGGPAAVSDEVMAAAGRYAGTVQRLGGTDRYGTMQLIAREIVALGGRTQRVVLARGDNFADALSASNLGTYGRAPIVLTRPDALHPLALETLRDVLAGAEVVIVGGEAAVSRAVAAALSGAGYDVSRESGNDRYGTSVAIARRAETLGADPEPVVVASGADFPDALGAGPVAHALGGVLVLAAPTDLANSPATADYLRDNAAAIETVIGVGGPNALSDTTLGAARRLIG